MPRKPIAKKTTRVTAVELEEPWVDPATGVVKRQLEWYEPVPEAPGAHRGRPRKGTTRSRAQRRRVKNVSKGYVMVDLESIGMLDLSRQEYRVFSFLASKMDGSGEIRVTNAYIAKNTGMTTNNVSTTMKSLRERHIVMAEAYGVWRINAWIAWSGDWKKWLPASKDDPEPRWSADAPPALAVVE